MPFVGGFEKKVKTVCCSLFDLFLPKAAPHVIIFSKHSPFKEFFKNLIVLFLFVYSVKQALKFTMPKHTKNDPSWAK